MVIFGSKSIAHILIFLFVNQRCYGTQLSKFLHIPLTPLQKALLRLENAGIISSHTEGKTRLYHFNSDYPLLNELEQLLKKIYGLLSAEEKKRFHFYQAQRIQQKQGLELLFDIWKSLSNIKQLHFIAHTRSQSEWNGYGKGNVQVTLSANNILIFSERGAWIAENGQETNFSNIFRWTFDRYGGKISLEHLRFGVDQPVFLFHLVPRGEYLESLDSHFCGEDSYFGQLKLKQKSIQLTWRIIGPKKNERLEYQYTV